MPMTGAGPRGLTVTARERRAVRPGTTAARGTRADLGLARVLAILFAVALLVLAGAAVGSGPAAVTAAPAASPAVPAASGIADPTIAADTPSAPEPDPGATDEPVEPSATSSQESPGPDPTEPTSEPTTSPEPGESSATAQPTESESVTPTGSVSPTDSATSSASATATPTASPTQSPSPTSRPVEIPATQPAAASSNISTGMVTVALVVLLLAGILVRAIARRDRRDRPDQSGPGLDAHTTGTIPMLPIPTRRPPENLDETQVLTPLDRTDPRLRAADRSRAETMTFLLTLGQAMIDSGDPVTHINASLEQVAQVNGVAGAEVLVMPTAMFVSVPGRETVQTAVAGAGSSPLRLDQIDTVFEVVEDAELGRVSPAVGLGRLAAARELPPSFSQFAQVTGYVGLTLGLSMLMMSSLAEMALAVVLGLAVGLLDWWAARVPQPFQVFLPVVSAFGVSLAVFLVGRAGLDVGGFSALIAPLVLFIPGALLTTGVIELATGQIISGSARLASGAIRLVLLALGILAAAQLVGLPATSIGADSGHPLGEFLPWLGVAVFGVGTVVNKCARPGTLPWIVLILYVAYAGQVIGGLLFGPDLAAFWGAALMTPVAVFVATQPSGPTQLVSFLPGFWILVPGAVGLMGVTHLLGDNQSLGLDTLVNAGVTMLSIALGVLFGLAVATGVSMARTAIAPPRRQP